MDTELKQALDELAQEPQIDRALTMCLILIGEGISLLLSTGDMERLKAFKYQCAQLFFEAEKAVASRQAGMN